MPPDSRTLDDIISIRIILQRLCLVGVKVSMTVRDQRALFQILGQEAERILLVVPEPELAAWTLPPEDKVSLCFEDRGFRYESVVTCKGPADWEGITCMAFSVPRVLRRADANGLAHFAPDTAPKVTFSNTRNAVLDGQIRRLGHDGFELTLQDPSRKIQDVLRMGEESTLDLDLEEDLRITAHARVAYFGANFVGMRFTDRVDQTVLDQYRSWLQGQERLQAQRDREAFEGGGRAAQREAPAAMPQLRVWVDRDPAILILTEEEGFARRMAEALGRKFGIVSLDYIKGSVKGFLAAPEQPGGPDSGWGRIRLVVIHNRLRLVSPLELSRQLVQQEQCPLPVLLAGSEEDLELKRNRALAAGAVDYVPVEPFKILAILRKLDETLKLFEG
jgi:CheY-like chemotaxis protein